MNQVLENESAGVRPQGKFFHLCSKGVSFLLPEFLMCRAFLVQAAEPETALYLDLLENSQEFIVSLLESWQNRDRKYPVRS